MVKQTTRGIQVSVETFYQKEDSNPIQAEFWFAYRISIENFGSAPIRLLRRKWIITEATGVRRVVEGEGVVGEQPVLYPQERYQYVSGAAIRTEIGSMVGHYEMQAIPDGEKILIAIPQFLLITPFKMN